MTKSLIKWYFVGKNGKNDENVVASFVGKRDSIEHVTKVTIIQVLLACPLTNQNAILF